MKILIDENLPKKLKKELSDFEIYSIQEMGWLGLKNGELIRSMIENKFDTLITFDQNLQYQQNLSTYPISIVLVNLQNNQFSTILPYIEKMEILLKDIDSPGIYQLITD
jgi:predicted nuclease of predicted toxin-antitoxin system